METIENEYRILKVGDVVVPDHVVIRCEPKGVRVPGETYATFAALCECTREDAWHKYVTWIVIARPNGFIAESGHYFQAHQEEEAWEDYQYR